MAEPGRDIERVFNEARKLRERAERDAYLASACAGDEALRARIERLLAAEAELGSFLRFEETRETPVMTRNASDSAATAISTSPSESPGTVIGRYKLLQRIGEGGFGVVYMTEQEEPVRRKVALKIIKLGMDTKQVIARFEAERQALAIMDHPNIAKVFDAGATETGRPYFVMELVKGIPITQYCDAHNFAPQDRLDLFVSVCQAVQHAHQKGIIHRDIKPSNVLVSQHDEKPVVKVIDFGIAKATAARLTEKTVFTEFRQMIGTPAYMSPEQAGLSDLDIDTRTDVYSLGVLLYELLTGTTPFDIKTLLSAGYAEVQRIIREVEPPTPSTRLSTMKDELPSVAANRKTEPARLTRLVRGDLDWIVMKCLEKERTRRYETANSLAADIQRYLGSEPVIAAPPSRAYRLRKFVRRNKGAVITAGTIAMAMILGFAGTLWQAQRARVQRDAAVVAREAESRERDKARLLAESEAQQRRIAESNEKKAAAINQFLLDMLGSADVRNIGRDAKVSQALDMAAARVRTAFKDRPDVEAAIHSILGQTYLSIGMLDLAEPQLIAALELNRTIHGEESIAFAETLGHMGMLKVQRGDLPGAIETYLRAVDLVEKASGPESEQTLAIRGDYGLALLSAKRNTEAESIMRDVLKTRIRVFGSNSEDVQRLTNSIAVALHNMERLDEAEQLYREAFDIGVRVLGPDHPDTLIAQMNLGSMLVSRKKLAEAEPIMVSAYTGIKKVFGDAHTKTAEAANALGNLYETLGRYKEALPFFEERVAICMRAQGENTKDAATAKQKLAVALMKMGDTTRAAKLLGEAIVAFTAIQGAESRDVLDARVDLTTVLLSTDRANEAEEIFKDILSSSPRVLGEDDSITVRATNGFGVMLMRQERFAEAEPFVRKAAEAARRVDGPDSPNAVINQYNLASALMELGRVDEAESLGRDTLDGAIRVFGPRHPTVATMRAGYATTLSKLGRKDEAGAQLRDAIAIAKAALGERNASPAKYGLQLARLMLDKGDAAAAEPLLREVLNVLIETRGAKDARTISAGLEMGRCLVLLGRFSEAELMILEAYAKQAETPGNGKHEAGQRIVDLYDAWHKAEPGKGYAEKGAAWQAKLDETAAATRSTTTEPASTPEQKKP